MAAEGAARRAALRVVVAAPVRQEGATVGRGAHADGDARRPHAAAVGVLPPGPVASKTESTRGAVRAAGSTSAEGMFAKAQAAVRVSAPSSG
jgi:hypothetical protein